MSSPLTLVFGGNGSLAAALRSHLPDTTVYVARHTAADCLAVGDYAAASPKLFAGFETVINCAGTTVGNPALMQHANIDAPRHLAELAQAAGVRRFVHVSSFSVFGRAPLIDQNTPIAPTTAYGRSKRTAEEILLGLARDDFFPVPVRLPAIVGGGTQDKLRRLVKLWLKLRCLPVSRTPVLRSMISVDLAAKVLADVAAGDEVGIVHAADSRPFTFRDAAIAVSRGAERKVGLLTLPDGVLGLVERWAPDLFASLYEHSLLAPDLNRGTAIPSDLYDTIARLARQEATA